MYSLLVCKNIDNCSTMQLLQAHVIKKLYECVRVYQRKYKSTKIATSLNCCVMQVRIIKKL